jgi:hypothetical protein
MLETRLLKRLDKKSSDCGFLSRRKKSDFALFDRLEHTIHWFDTAASKHRQENRHGSRIQVTNGPETGAFH